MNALFEAGSDITSGTNPLYLIIVALVGSTALNTVINNVTNRRKLSKDVEASSVSIMQDVTGTLNEQLEAARTRHNMEIADIRGEMTTLRKRVTIAEHKAEEAESQSALVKNRVATYEQRVKQLETILRDAGISVPPWPWAGSGGSGSGPL